MAQLNMTDFTSWLEELRSLLNDPLRIARDAAASGQTVIGYVSRDIPVELILAAKAFPVRLWALTEADTSAADCYLESGFTPESRSICEQWLRGDLDFIKSVIFPRSQDAAQRLYYYLSELQRCGRAKGPAPSMFDVSTIARSTSFDHTLSAVKQLASTLKVDTVALAGSSARYKKRIELLDQLSATRLASPSLRGSDAFSIQCAADLDWRESYDAQLAQYIESAPRFTSRKRVLLAGNMPPDTRLHLAIEQAGGNVVSEYIEHRHPQVMPGADILADIARRHHRGSTISQQMLSSSTLLVDATREVNAHGVVLWAIEEDETLPWEISRQAAALRASSIPVLVLSRQSWHLKEEVLAQVSAFTDSLNT